KGRTPPGFALGPYVAPHLLNHLPHYCQTNPGSFVVLFVMQPSEYLEHFVAVFHLKSNAVVSNPKQPVIILLLSPDFDSRRFHCPRELDCVVEAVVECTSQRAGADRQRTRLDFYDELDGTLTQPLSLLNQTADERADLELAVRHFLILNPRILEQVINETAHLLGRSSDVQLKAQYL